MGNELTECRVPCQRSLNEHNLHSSMSLQLDEPGSKEINCKTM